MRPSSPLQVIILFLVMLHSCSEHSRQVVDHPSNLEVIEAMLDSEEFLAEINGRSVGLWKVGEVLNSSDFNELKSIAGVKLSSPGPYQHGEVACVVIINDLIVRDEKFIISMRILESPPLTISVTEKQRKDIELVLDLDLNMEDWYSKTVTYNSGIQEN